MPVKNLQARYQTLKVLFRISDLINSTANSTTLLRRILREAVREMKATSGSISLVNETDNRLDIKVGYGMDVRAARQMRLRMGEGVTGIVAQSGKPLRVKDVSGSNFYIELKSGVRSELAVPLRSEGKVIGVLNVDSSSTNAFSSEDEELLLSIANQAARVIQTSMLYSRITQQSQRLEALFDVGQALISPDPLPDILQRITRAVLDIADIKLCSVMLLNQ
jgi:Nif-specific regulatory protein